MKKITDKYGNTIGSVEKRNNDYILKDKYGFKEGSVEKGFLSDNYNIYDKNGKKTGKVEPNLFGNGASIKDKSGANIGTIIPVGGLSTGGAIALLVIGIMIYISFDNLTEHFSNALTIGAPEFFTITVSNGIFILYNIISICIGKGIAEKEKNSFFTILLGEIISGCVIYMGLWVVLGIIGIIEGEGFWNMLLMVPLGALMYCVSFLIVMIIIALIFSVIIRVRQI